MNRQASNINGTLVGQMIVDHSYVVGASFVGSQLLQLYLPVLDLIGLKPHEMYWFPFSLFSFVTL